MSVLGEKIKELRLARKMSQRELAKLSGVHQTAVCFLERGIRPRSYEVARKLAPALGISHVELAELIFGQEPA